MNYYSFHIGDYAAHTRRLSLMEDLAYRRLLDEYYLQECPLQGTAEEIARAIGMRDQTAAVEYVLRTYFEELEVGWVNQRCDQELEKYQTKQAQKVLAGKASAQRRASERSTSADKQPTDVQLTNNQEPITKNQDKPIGGDQPKPGRAKPGRQLPDEFRPNQAHQDLALQLGVNLEQELQQFTDHHKAKGSVMKDWDAALRTWIRNAKRYAPQDKGKGRVTWPGAGKQTYQGGVNDDGTF